MFCAYFNNIEPSIIKFCPRQVEQIVIIHEEKLQMQGLLKYSTKLIPIPASNGMNVCTNLSKYAYESKQIEKKINILKKYIKIKKNELKKNETKYLKNKLLNSSAMFRSYKL